MLNQITVFECDTCKRKIELELDDRRPYPTRCSITHKCPGHYVLIGKKQTRSSLFPAIIYGLKDYIPRGSIINQRPINEESPRVSISAGPQQLVLAATSEVLEGTNKLAVENTSSGGIEPLFVFTIPNSNSSGNSNLFENPNKTHKILVELYEIFNTATAYNEYYFLRNENILQISGADDSLEKTVLRFKEEDNLIVYVNGINLPRKNSPEAISTGKYFSTIINNTSREMAIRFTPPLLDANNVIKIYVSNKINTFTDPTKSRVLVFKGSNYNDPVRRTSSWGDVSYVHINYQRGEAKDRFLFTCTDFEVLPNTHPLELNKQYFIKSIQAITLSGGTVELDPSNIHMLLGQPPYSFADKSMNITLNMKEAIDLNNGVILEYLKDEFGYGNLYTKFDKLTNLVYSIKFLKTFDDIGIKNPGDTQVNQYDTLMANKYVIGYV